MSEEILYTKDGKIRKRKPKVKNVYFTQETEDAILAYVDEVDLQKRDILYSKYIHYAFYKLAENIIHSFKFYYTEVENLDDLKHEIITVLLSKLKLYNPAKGKAYSYFGTIVKRWLILYNQKNYKNLIASIDIDTVDFEEPTPPLVIEEEKNDFINNLVKYIDSKLFTLFPDTLDQKIADAILILLKRREFLENVNKKAIFIYIKEMVPEANSIQISKVLKDFKDLYIMLFNHWTKYNYLKY